MGNNSVLRKQMNFTWKDLDIKLPKKKGRKKEKIIEESKETGETIIRDTEKNIIKNGIL